MPDKSTEVFTHIPRHLPVSTTSTSGSSAHIAQQSQYIDRDQGRQSTEQGTELTAFEIIKKSQSRNESNPSQVNLRPKDGSDSGLEQEEDERLLPIEEASGQMNRQSRKQKYIQSGQLGDQRPVNSEIRGANGHPYGDANTLNDMRYKTSNSPEAMAGSRSVSELDFSEPGDSTSHGSDLITTSFADLPRSDKRNFLMLCLLYFLQGIPMGLAMGSLPFLLKTYFSYGQIGIFSLAAYPYSLKLLWSPIVDAVWSRRLGRRKSWITPIQIISGLSMIWLGARIDIMMVAAGENAGAKVWSFTGWWFLLVLLCATQDIAVDGWAISLISTPNLSYASTAQTVGLTAGSFLSHTVFLAFNTPDLANRWFRATPQEHGLVSLGDYMTFWGWVYLLVTLGLAALKKEAKTKERDGIMEVYDSMWRVLNLKHIHSLIIIMLISKLGFVTNESVTNLKLLDKGFGQANLALVVLIDFPFEIGLGYYAGKWSAQYTPLRLWCWAFGARLLAAIFAQVIVMIYPSNPVPLWYMTVVIVGNICSTFMSTIMFVAGSAFFARIADPAIGGTYMTMMATVTNLGGTFPKIFVLRLVDAFTVATCEPLTDLSSFKSTDPSISPVTSPFSCVLEADKHRCTDGGGTCIIERDGFYYTNIIFVIIGAVTFWGYIQTKAIALQALPLRAWRISK